MRNLEIMSITNAYQKTDGTLKLPVSVAWTRRVNMSKLLSARRIIEEALKEVQVKYADDEHSDPSEEGDGRTVKPEYMAEFAKDQSEILLQETDVDIKKVPVEALGDIVLTDTQMDTLAFMIEG